jgi:hypothetical protein
MICCFASILAWAMLPSISCFQRVLSKEMDSVNDSTVPDVFCVNLPAQGFFM